MTSSSNSLPSSCLEEERDRLGRLAIYELEWRRCEHDPWWFIKNYCITMDELDPVTPFKRFPERNHPHLSRIVDRIQTAKTLFIEKSRQVMVTWTVAAYVLWLLIFRRGNRIFLQSKKQEDANENLDRVGGMWRRLPSWMRGRCPLKITTERIRNQKTLSVARAIPQGIEIVAGYTVSFHWSDETAKQADCEAVWQNIKPTLGAGKGRVVFTTSAKGGTWAHAAVTDSMEPGEPPPPLYINELCHGLTERKLARNGFVVLRLHYSADPEKRDPEWIRVQREGMTEAQWQQEFEINWEAYSGIPALPRFTVYRDTITITPFRIPDTWPRYAAADYGYRNPYCCLFFATGPDGESYCYWEHYRPGPLEMHVEAIKRHPDFWKLRAFILDQSCWAATQQAGAVVRSIAELHQDAGIYPIPSDKVRDPVKIAAYDKAWAGVERGDPPQFYIFRTCHNLIRELPAIRWAEFTAVQQQTRDLSETLVDKDNHAFDAAAYFLLLRQNTEPRMASPIKSKEEALREFRRDLQEHHIHEAEQMSRDREVLDDGLE